MRHYIGMHSNLPAAGLAIALRKARFPCVLWTTIDPPILTQIRLMDGANGVCLSHCFHQLMTMRACVQHIVTAGDQMISSRVQSHASSCTRQSRLGSVLSGSQRPFCLNRSHVMRRCQSSSAGRRKVSVKAQSGGYPPYLPALDDGYEATVAFTEYANWLIPGSLMTGRYPFVEPSRCTKRSDGEAMLEMLISSGIKTFVSLQHEIPAQAEMPLKGVDGFQGYKAPATLIAAALSDPPTVDEMNGLRTPYLDKFLPPKKVKAGSQAVATRKIIELDFLHHPIVDLSVPKKGQLDELVDMLMARIEAGDVLYVHCWGGRGRAGTVGACVLGKMYGLSAKESLERVQRAFDTRNDGGRRSPETDEQHALVSAYLEN